MALSEANQLKVCQILQITPSVLEYQLTILATDFTSTVQTAIEAELTRWTTLGAKFVAIEPNTANYGAKIDPTLAKNDIRKNIAILLERPDWAGASSGNYLPRG